LSSSSTTSHPAGTTSAETRDPHIATRKRTWQTSLAARLGLMAVMYVPIYRDTMDWLMPLIFVGRRPSHRSNGWDPTNRGARG
jgi:Cu+-exporting ATPase